MADADKEARRRELEEKKRKLAELRKRNEDKRVGGPSVRESLSGGFPDSSTASVEDVVKSIVGVDLLAPSSTSISGVESVRQSMAGLSTGEPSVSASQEIASTIAYSRPQRRAPQLSVHHLEPINVMPKILETYNKETQTLPTQREEEEDERTPARRRQQQQQAHAETPALPLAGGADGEAPEAAGDAEAEAAAGIPELTPAERAEVISSGPFQAFFSRSARIVERALSQPDVAADYAVGSGDSAAAGASSRESLSYAVTLFDEKWSKHRAVTDLSWSPKHPELLAAAYGSRADALTSEPDGLVLVWSTANRLQPEYVFTAASPVTSMSFHRYAGSQIIGGLYSGQIVLWDLRTKNAPVLKTPRSGDGHTHPIYAMQVVGTQNAHNLITASTDGRVCSWSLSMLSQPQEVLELKDKKQNRTELPVTALAFQEGDVNSFLVGTESASLFRVYRYGSKQGVADEFKGHAGPVTAVHPHPAVGGQDHLSHLLLSSSTDWTVKLWSAKGAGTPLHTFEDLGDYVFDVQWSPTHPSAFATADGTGALSLWDLVQDSEAPIAVARRGPHALNKARWSGDGRRLAAGDSDGGVHLYDVSGEVAAPPADAMAKFEERLEAFASAERERDAAASAAGAGLAAPSGGDLER
eukprot:tig00020830_g14455.t1